MRIAILPTPEDIAVVAADRIQSLLERKPSAVLGLATGSTPLPLYDELTKRYEAGEISFASTQSFNLTRLRLITPRQFAMPAALTSRSLESVQTDTSASMSPVGPSPRVLTSMFLPNRLAAITLVSSTAILRRFLPTASPRAWEPSWSPEKPC